MPPSAAILYASISVTSLLHDTRPIIRKNANHTRRRRNPTLRAPVILLLLPLSRVFPSRLVSLLSRPRNISFAVRYNIRYPLVVRSKVRRCLRVGSKGLRVFTGLSRWLTRAHCSRGGKSSSTSFITIEEQIYKGPTLYTCASAFLNQRV